MTILDYSIVFIYLIGMVFVGVYFKKKASAGVESFFLGNRELSWWTLGASGMASNIDISGTMINVALIYAHGAMGFFVELRGGIVLILAFLMIFMGKWNRRAKVITLAEWMELRFGNTLDGRIARGITAIAILISSIAIVSYLAIGSGKFVAEFLELPPWLGIPSSFWAASIMIIVTLFYTVTSGILGVVWTDVFQGGLIMIMIIVVCAIAFHYYPLPDSFLLSVPLSNGEYFQFLTSKESWTNIMPSWERNFPANSIYSIYNLFGVAILFYLIKTVIEGSGGTGGYMIQRFFAAKNDREVGKLSLFWVFTLAFRWPFVAAVAMMGIAYGTLTGNVIQDPEAVLPTVVIKMLAFGIKGLVVAGLIAAGMSTFSSIVNSAASYWVEDIYKGFINPKANEKKSVFQSRLSSVIIVVIGLLLVIRISSINQIWSWLTMGLGSGLIIPLIIRWYWWRLNGFGFSAGVACGMLAALIQLFLIPYAPEYVSFLIITVSSFAGLLIVTLLTPQPHESTLLNFYKKTLPFGLWSPLYKHFSKEEIEKIKLEHKRDGFATLFAVPWQLTLFLIPMMLMIRRWEYCALFSVIFIICSIGLYYFWYRHLSTIE
ncbi:MAG: sodium:solute symporter [Ignavibacteria bacterium]|nr:sodium:solute symporter [Ignavibacteria bacterium]